MTAQPQIDVPPGRDADAQGVQYSVVVPVLNEHENIDGLLAEIAAAMASLAFEVVVVDDGSSDGSAAHLRERAAGLPWLRLVQHERNRGQSAALCSGIDAARGRWIVTLDGDGQNDPADIPTLIATLQGPGPGPALVCGHRRERRDDLLRRVSSRVANRVRATLLGDGTPDTGCGLKVFSRSRFRRLPRFDHMHRFLPALVQRDGGEVASVPVSHRPRVHGQSKYGIRNRLGVGIVDLLGVMWLTRRKLDSRKQENS